MNAFRMIVAAAAIATLPLTAGAVSTSGNVSPGGTYDVFAKPYVFGAQFVESDVAGTYSFFFENTSATEQTVALSVATVNQFSDVFLGGITFTWVSGGDTHSVTQGVDDKFMLSTLLGANETDELRISWGDPQGGDDYGPQFDFQLKAVPLPAPILLLMGALGGLGFVGRRKKVASA